MNENKVLLSVKNLDVKFHVRGRVLTAIRDISLDVYENESIAIVGESGSGKSVFTKTFAGMLDGNGFIENGSIIFHDDELADTTVKLTSRAKKKIEKTYEKLNEYSKFEYGSETYKQMLELESEKKIKSSLSDDQKQVYETELKKLKMRKTVAYNQKLTLDASKEKTKIKEVSLALTEIEKNIKELEKQREQEIKNKEKAVQQDVAYLKDYKRKLDELKSRYAKDINVELDVNKEERNKILAKEIYLSVGRYGLKKRYRMIRDLLKAFEQAMKLGIDLMNEEERNAVFDTVAFRVRYIDETDTMLHGTCVLNLAQIKFEKDWGKIRGGKIATVFQDPMTSLNPIITIGKQITSVIMKHQDCSEAEARERALKLMQRVGISNVAERFDDYPFQYSGGMRQRIVIAIALSCHPKILICDEPTTALDVTIQAQILDLLKDLQKEYGFAIVFITHDLGVVANIADRVAVIYSGQIVEIGTSEEIFYDPRHPYTWALLSSLPQLAQKNTTLFSINGTPPSLYNSIVGDAFAPRNPYCMTIDTLKEPPMFQVTGTHFAKTWLLDERAPKVEKPEIIQNSREKLLKTFNIGDVKCV